MGADISVKTDIKPESIRLSQLTPSKVAKVKQNLDKNYSSGGLDKNQLLQSLSISKREADILFDYFDMDGNGVIDSYEFTCALAMLVYASSDLRAEFLFKMYDFDSNNYLTRAEIVDYLRNHLIATKKAFSSNELEKKADEFVRLADLDMDKKINLKEFQTYLAKNKEYFKAAEGYNSVLTNAPVEVSDDLEVEKMGDHFEEDENFNTADECGYDSDLEQELKKGGNEISDQQQKIKEGAEFVTKVNDGPFKVEEEMQGTEFSACKPWLGVVLHSIPSDYQPHAGESNAPENTLELEFVHGYRCFDTRNNLFYTADNKIVYHTAAVGIVYDKEAHQQTFFFDHIDDITALAIHPSKNIVVTGEIGPWPMICVWDINTKNCMARFNGPLQKGINHLTFSADGKFIYATAADDDHHVACFEWEKGVVSAKATDLKTSKQSAKSSPGLFAVTKGPRANILGVAVNKQNNLIALTCVKEVHFGQVAKGSISLKKATGLKGNNVTSIMCAGFLGNTLVTGSSSGDVITWAGTSASKNIKAHVNGVTCIYIRENDVGFITGGNDNGIKVWDSKFAITRTIDLTNTSAGLIKPKLRSICEDSSSGNLLAGCRSGEIIEIVDEEVTCLLRGHYDLELWALAVSPNEDKYYTCGQEGLLSVWNVSTRKCEKSAQINVKAENMAISPDGKHLAIGTTEGDVHVYLTSTLKQFGIKKDRKQPIGSIKYSPNGNYLVVGSVDFLIFVYDVKQNYKLLKKMKGHVSRVTHIDFGEVNESVIQSNSTSYDILFHDLNSGNMIPGGATSYKDETWATYTLPIGWASQGIWPPCASGDDINAVDRDKTRKILATADDWGKVKLFKYPCPVEKSSFNRYVGHSSHVTNVRFTSSNNYLISTGGNDKAIFQWRHKSDDQAEKEADTFNNMNVDDSNPNNDHVAESKWDVEEEIIGTEFGASKPFLGEVKASTPKDFVLSKNANTPPKEQLSLKFVHGYRNFDTRNNVAYSANGNVVYHAAALGISLDSNNNQTFFKGHDEDVVAFAIHPNKKIIATGQMAKAGKAKLIDIFVWDSETMEPLANLKGFHLRAVRLLKFSPDGSKLLSGGEDDDNSIAVYDWKNQKMIGSSPVDKARVLDGDWSSDTEFATCGLKHIKFFELNGRNIKATKGLFGSIKIEALLTMLFVADKKICLCGDSKGNLIVFSGRSATKSIKAHTGQVWTLFESKGLIYSGGQDGLIKIYDAKFTAKDSIDLTTVTTFNPGVRAIDISGGKMLIATRGGDILEFASKNQPPKVLMQSHYDNELWGLTVNPSNPNEVLTGGGDMTLRKWDAISNKMIGSVVLDQDFRAIDWSSDGKFIVIGSMKGKIYALDAKTLKVLDSYQSIFKTEKQWIQELKISPNSELVAYGGHGGPSKVEILSLKSGSKVLNKHSVINPRFTSSLTHLDWSKDSEFIVCNSLAYELKFLSISSKNLIAASASTDIDWATWTCIFGFPVQGIWPEASTGYVINYTCMSNNRKVIAAGDDFSQVKLYRNPCVVEHQQYSSYKGHSSHVPKVRFSSNDSYLFSVGGNDKCLFVWETDFGTGDIPTKKVTKKTANEGFGNDEGFGNEGEDDNFGNDQEENLGDDGGDDGFGNNQEDEGFGDEEQTAGKKGMEDLDEEF